MRTLFLGKNPVAWLIRMCRAKGPWRVCKVMWHAAVDATWDKIHGTETLARIAPDRLETDSRNKGEASYYGATRARPLVRLLESLNLPRSSGFVDFGSGKGRVLLIAAEHGFERVVGVEFSQPLCAQARRNLEAFRRRRRLKSDVVVVHSDVVDYPVGANESVFFMYDPFSAAVLARVLENIRRSIAQWPRPIWLLYNSPRHHDVIEASGLFPSSRLAEIGGNEFRVYRRD